MVSSRPADLWELSDLATPWAIHVIATLGIATQIQRGNSKLSSLAAATSSDPYMLGCTMRLLISKGLFTEPERDVFALNDAVAPLLDSSALLGFDLESFGGRMAHAWGTLFTLVRSGRAGYAERFGRPFWDDLAAHPRLAADFNRLIGPDGHGIPDPEILPDGDWSEIRSVVDVGGGTGALLTEILRARPTMAGILVDLPSAVHAAEARFAAAGIADRAETIAGSFFDQLPQGADLYILKSILNDWPDAETRQILARCAEASRPGGRIAIIGGVTPDDQLSSLTIEMVLIGGTSRPVGEFSLMAAELGLEVEQTGRTGSGAYVVVCNHAVKG